MFSTCLHCHASLGANAHIETFPVGRRLAFDALRGRLWVVCRQCRNWNLTPVEERFAAVEECERAYRATAIRVSTDNIGLATLRDGVDLVRVGKPLRPEFAAWRYGARRRRRPFAAVGRSLEQRVTDVSAAMVGVAAAVAGLTTTLTGSTFVQQHLQSPLETAEAELQFGRVLAHVRTADGSYQPLRFSEVARLEVVAVPDRPTWRLRVAHAHGQLEIDGGDAGPIAGPLLARLNHGVGSRAQLQTAARLITDHGDADQYIRATAAMRHTRRRKNTIFWNDAVGVLGLTATERLALEIAVHEDTERRALEGELAALERAWHDAEEIAAISDALFRAPTTRDIGE